MGSRGAGAYPNLGLPGSEGHRVEKLAQMTKLWLTASLYVRARLRGPDEGARGACSSWADGSQRACWTCDDDGSVVAGGGPAAGEAGA